MSLIGISTQSGERKTAIVRGGGDLATGVIYRLWRARFDVLCLETELPTTVRRPVSVAQAVFDGEHAVENMKARLIGAWEDFSPVAARGEIPVLVDPDGLCIDKIKPDLLVDAIVAKRNTGTHNKMARLVLAIGPGFCAPRDAHGVIETKRGHTLGRLITEGEAIANTGIPGMEMGYTVERLLRAPARGQVEPLREIGERVAAGAMIAMVGGAELRAGIPGVLRGLIHPSVTVEPGCKIGDVDPRNEPSHCFTITDKALAIGGGVLEAVLSIGVGENKSA